MPHDVSYLIRLHPTACVYYIQILCFLILAVITEDVLLKVFPAPMLKKIETKYRPTVERQVGTEYKFHSISFIKRI